MNTYTINQLYEFTPYVEPTTSSGRNPLTIEGALNEAEFVDMRLSAQRSRAGILLDTRLCEDFEGSNTALIVLTGVGKVHWSNEDWTRQRPWHAEYASLSPRTSVWAKPPSPWATESRQAVWAVDASDASEQTGVGTSLSMSTTNEGSDLPEYILEFGSLSVSGLNARIYIGHIDGLDAAIPDMTELPDAEIIAGFPQWPSVMDVREHYVYPA